MLRVITLSVHDIASQLDDPDTEEDMFADLDDSYQDEEWKPPGRRDSSSSSDNEVAMRDDNSDCSLPPPQGESGDIGPSV